MAFKTILVCLTTEHAANQILLAACLLARRFNAHLIGVHTLPAIVPYPGIALHSSELAFQEFNDQVAAQSERIKELFDTFTDQPGFTSEWRALPARSTQASEQLVQVARRSDLIFVAAPDKATDRFDQADIQEQLIIESGRPVLFVPPDWQDKAVGTSPLIAWNASRESVLATHAAMPFLISAHSVVVAAVETGRGEADRLEGHQLAVQLARHGVNATVNHLPLDGSSVGEQIVNQARVDGCDLVVMGAYGHMRLHRIVFGDTTDFMLENADVPVLFAG